MARASLALTLVLGLLFPMGSAYAATATVLPSAKHGDDSTGENLSEITAQDGSDPGGLDGPVSGDGIYTVDSDSIQMRLDSFDTSALSGVSDQDITAVTLHVRYGATDPDYNGNRPVRWRFEGQDPTNTGITPTDGGWYAGTYDLFAQGVDTINEIQTIDIDFVNNSEDSKGMAHFDYIWIEVTYTAPNSPPTLTVNEPDGASDTVTQGANYNINYDLADSEDVVTVDFFYDDNNSGLDGTAISGACASAAEGTGVSCSWDTSGVTPGTYYVYGITNDGTNPAVNDYSPGQITINAPNTPPNLTVNEPNGTSDTVTQGTNYSINYDLADSEDAVTVAFFYDDNNSGLDGTAISGACASAAEGTGVTCSWDTSGVTPGTYYVYGITNDGTNPQVDDYSPGQITINAPNNPPTLTVNEPNGASDTVTQGASYSINYDLDDTDDVVTVDFFYDDNNSGLDGTAISGACASAAEGTGVTCSWDTTGVTPGTYYVYGVTNDGTNPAVNDYSPGQITINAPPATIDWGSCRTESGRASIVGTSGTVTLNQAISDLSKAFVLVDSTSANTGNANADEYFATGEITDANTLTFTRVGTNNNLEVSYQLVECFNDEFNVERGDITLSGAATSNAATISSVDTALSMVVVNSRSSDASRNQNQSRVTGELTNGTTVTVSRDAGGTDTVVHYQVVEFNASSGVTLQTGESTVSGTHIIGSPLTVDITDVNDSSSWLYFSGACPTSGLDDCTIAGNIKNSGADLQFYHESEGTVRARWYVVEFPNNGEIAVQRGISNYSDSVDPATHNITIPTPVSAVTKAYPYVTNTTLGNGTAFPRNMWVERLSGTNTIELQGWNTDTSNADAQMEWQVVEFVSGINNPPTLTVNEPNGASDTVSQGASYSINYDLADSDDVVTVDFFYDDNNSGLDGTAISGACASAAEGTGVNCSWDTSSVPPGTYFVYGITNDGTNPAVNDYSPGQITINAPNSPATLDVNQPDGTSDTIAEGGSFTVNYDLSDSDDVTTASFFYETDGNGAGGTAISGCDTQPEATGGTCTWDTSGVAPGDYYVYGTTSGDGAGAATEVSTGTMTINDAPALSISEPNGATVSVGQVYNITYTLTDSDDTITTAFFYDDNAAGFNGTAISGCGSAAEGSGVTCAWDTSGLTPGDYYVYGISTTDAYNSAAQTYSPGVITISNNSVASLDVNQPDGTNDTITEGDSFTINYDLSDNDDVTTVSFFYETDGNGAGGTAISGCATQPEATAGTCVWNTSGVAPGNYYVYGTTSGDGAGTTTVVSSDVVTITAAPASPLSFTSGDDGTSPGSGDSIAGVSRTDGGDDRNNYQSGKLKINLEYEFSIDFVDDSGESPVVEPRLYIAHRDAPTEGAGGDFFVYPLVCTGATWGSGKTCTTTTKLGPADTHKFYFYAEKTDGTVLRKPASGYIDGPDIQLIEGYSLVGVSRNIDTPNHDGFAAFNSPLSYGWVSAGLDTAFGSTFNGSYAQLTFDNPAETGRGYYVYKWSAKLPQLGSNADVTAPSHTITLQAGWNLISNPYNGNVKLDDVEISQNGGTPNTWSNAAGSNWIEPAIYYYLGTDWGDTHTSEFGSGAELVPWLGYWMYVKDDANTYELIINKPAQ